MLYDIEYNRKAVNEFRQQLVFLPLLRRITIDLYLHVYPRSLVAWHSFAQGSDRRSVGAPHPMDWISLGRIRFEFMMIIFQILYGLERGSTLTAAFSKRYERTDASFSCFFSS